MTYPIIDWNGLYGEGWADDIVPEAFSHPAKYSRALIRHIYQYLIDNGLLKRGMRVIDPFGGVALGALDAQLQGLHWVGCELEPKFVELGNANLALWRTRYAPHFPRWGSAVLLQGDSRRIGEVVRGAGGIVSSPPFNDSDSTNASIQLLSTNKSLGRVHAEDGYGTSPGQLGAMPSGSVDAILSSPPYDTHVIRKEADPNEGEFTQGVTRGHHAFDPYGESAGQLGAMPSGDFGALLSSPPYIDSLSAESDGIDWSKVSDGKGGTRDFSIEPGQEIRLKHGKEYGKTEGQLGGMQPGDVNAIIASPPFLQTSGGTGVKPGVEPGSILDDASLIARHSAGNAAARGYGESEGQLQSMREGEYDAIVGSPPYDPGQHSGSDTPSRSGLNADDTPRGGETRYHYGEADGQMQAMREGDIDAIIASPPFTNQIPSHDNFVPPHDTTRLMDSNYETAYGKSDGQLASLPEGDVNAIIASPPFHNTNLTTDTKFMAQVERDQRNGSRLQPGLGEYGHTPGQLANAPEGKFDSVVSSPPFTGVIGHDGGRDHMPAIGNYGDEYGNTEGQLADAPEGAFSSVVASPPYEGGQVGRGELGNRKSTGGSDGEPDKVLDAMQHGYSDTPDNLGNSEGDTFWSAALTIVSECYKLLAPGSVAVWICKDYVRNKRRVPFSDQWRQLCEKVGFTTLTEVHAWVVEDKGTQLGMMETEDKHHKTERKSFFRRLAEKKGSPRIDWETVWIMRKETP